MAFVASLNEILDRLVVFISDVIVLVQVVILQHQQ